MTIITEILAYHENDQVTVVESMKTDVETAQSIVYRHSKTVVTQNAIRYKTTEHSFESSEFLANLTNEKKKLVHSMRSPVVLTSIRTYRENSKPEQTKVSVEAKRRSIAF